MFGGEGRNRPDFPAVAPQICLILLAIQAKSALSDPIVFNPFGVRFGVRLQTCPVTCPATCPVAMRFSFLAFVLRLCRDDAMKAWVQSSSMSDSSWPTPNSPMVRTGLGRPNTPDTSGCGAVAVGP